MSYYFSILTPLDRPIFSLELGTSKGGGDGIPRFSTEARAMNPHIVHAALDMVDEAFWMKNQMYLRRIDTFSSAHISCFLTPTSHRFLLLHLPHPPNTSPPPPPSQSSNPNAFPPFLPYSSSPANPSLGGTTPFTGTSLTSSRFSSLANSTASATGSGSSASGGGGGGGIPNNPTSPATEEAIRLFFWEVFESWIKGQLSPFDGGEGDLKANMGRSEVFRGKVVGAGRKYL